MARPKLLRSGRCVGNAHDRCPHFSHVDVGSLRRPLTRGEHRLTLCGCGCHAGCPLAGRGTVAREVWRAECTCPGAVPARERQQRADERRQEVKEVLAEVRREGHAAADDVEARLRDVYLRHGEPPPPGLAGWARVVAAGTARRGTRTPRLLWTGVRAVTRTVRWAEERPPSTSRDSRA